MSFSQLVAERALVASGRCCCICHKFCGTKMELHHIKQRAYGGEDTFKIASLFALIAMLIWVRPIQSTQKESIIVNQN